MHKAYREQKDSSLVRARKLSFIDNKQCRPGTSPNISSSLLFQEPPTLIRRLVIKPIMECNHSANKPQLMQSVLVMGFHLC